MEKLVRDRVPQRIRAAGGDVVGQRASDDEFPVLLAAKLIEDAHAFQKMPTLAALADVAEVLQTICGYYGWRPDAFSQMRRERISRDGGFDRRLVLEVADVG